MDPALRADVLKRLAPLYAAMDAAYEAAAVAYRFACTGCAESCCRTRFHHHTLVEYHGLRDGFEQLPGVQQAEILARAESWCAEQARPVSDARSLCPLNAGGCWVLYTHRPMICRLHGIPHELHPPGRAPQLGPGCAEFHRCCGRAGYHPFDRTPLYAELARLESEFQQILGPRRKIRMTIAEMLLDDGVLP